MSGYTDDKVLRRGVLHGETAFFQKPFTPDQLARKVRTVLDRGAVIRRPDKEGKPCPARLCGSAILFRFDPLA
jgi:hypothetical protein